MDAPTIAALKRMDAMVAALEQLPRLAAEVYANGSEGRGRPIVWKHFTAGNAQRYQWAPLSRNYAMQKAGHAKALQKGMKARGAVVAKLDKAVPFRSNTGKLRGEGTGTNLPMLVRSGHLRDAVVSATLHRIAVSGDTATVTFTGLPKYAQYHDKGTGKLPQRSPVLPNEADRQEILDHLNKIIDGLTGGTKGVAVSGTTIPGAARVV